MAQRRRGFGLGAVCTFGVRASECDREHADGVRSIWQLTNPEFNAMTFFFPSREAR